MQRSSPESAEGSRLVDPRSTELASKAVPGREDTIIIDETELAKAEANLRDWIGKPIRLALEIGLAHEGVLREVSNGYLRFEDGTEVSLVAVLAAEIVRPETPE